MELKNLLISLLYAAPMLIVYLTTVILGMVYLNKHKKAAMLAMLGGMLAGLTVIGSFAVNQVMNYQLTHPESDRDDNADHTDYLDDFEKREKEREQQMAVRSAVGIAANVFEAVGVGMIAFAVFAGRKAAPSRERWQEDDDLRRREARDDRGRTRPT